MRLLRGKMAGLLKLVLTGASGASYSYAEMELRKEFYLGIPGNFVLAKAKKSGADIICAGEHLDLYHLPEPLLARALHQFGALSTLVRINRNAAARRAEVADIIAAYDPILNKS